MIFTIFLCWANSSSSLLYKSISPILAISGRTLKDSNSFGDSHIGLNTYLLIEGCTMCCWKYDDFTYQWSTTKPIYFPRSWTPANSSLENSFTLFTISQGCKWTLFKQPYERIPLSRLEIHQLERPRLHLRIYIHIKDNLKIIMKMWLNKWWSSLCKVHTPLKLVLIFAITSFWW